MSSNDAMITKGEGERSYPMLKRYEDLLANVRWDGKYHSIRQLITPNDPAVQEVANTLIQKGDFIDNCQNFVNNFTTYVDEIGDYWGYPYESIESQGGDCDDLSILLGSLLRNYYGPDKVFCAIGLWKHDGREGGHMWVMVEDKEGNSKIVEATAPAGKELYGKYEAYALFNDQYAFSSDFGLKEFDLIPVPLGVKIQPELVAP
jgi:hypothetical protein